MHKLKIFISSPGDVNEERALCAKVIKRLGGEFAHRTELEPIFWEHEPLRASGTFQDGIPLPSETDIVISILWNRLGTRLPKKYTFEGDESPPTGTEFEVRDAIRAFEKFGTPDLLIYKKNAEKPILGIDETEVAQFFEQKNALNKFTKDFFFNEDGSIKAAFSTFEKSSDFETYLEVHLRKLIDSKAPPGMTEIGSIITWTEGSPFRGLERFDLKHAPIFFGRSRAISDVIRQLKSQHMAKKRFLLIQGMSGSGKSSLVFAGVLPILMEPGVIEGIGLWRYSIFNASNNNNLYLALAQALISKTALPELLDLTDVDQLATKLKEKQSKELLFEVLSAIGAKARIEEGLEQAPVSRLVLVLDQLEEVFTSENISFEQRQQFFTTVRELTASGLVWCIGTLRSDFYHRCEEIPELMEMKEGDGQYHLQPPSVVELKEMISLPVKAAGLHFEKKSDGSSLDEVILEQAVKNPEALPLLGFCLEELYNFGFKDRLLSFENYEAIGRFEGALTRKAEQTLKKLSQKTQNALPQVMRRLVVVADDVARKWYPENELKKIDGANELIEAFKESRLLIAQGQKGVSLLTLTHEVLLRNWPFLVDLIEQDREFLILRNRVEQSSNQWLSENKDESFLLPEGRALNDAVGLLERRREDLDQSLINFIKVSKNKVDKARKLKKLLITGVIILLSCLTLVSVLQWIRASTSEKLALLERDKAELANKKATQEKLKADFEAENARKAKKLSDQQVARLYAERGRQSLNNNLHSEAAVFLGASLKYEKDNPLYNLLFNRSLELLKSSEDSLLKGHSDRINTMVLSSDKNILVTGSNDLSIKFWDLNNKQVLASIDQSNPAKKLLIKGDQLFCQFTNRILCYDVNSRELLFELDQHYDNINSFTFNEDYLLTGAKDRQLILWSSNSGEMVKTSVLSREVLIAGFVSAAQYFCLEIDGSLTVWDVDPNKMEPKKKLNLLNQSSSVTVPKSLFIPDKDILVSDISGTLSVYKLKPEEQEIVSIVSLDIKAENLLQLLHDGVSSTFVYVDKNNRVVKVDAGDANDLRVDVLDHFQFESIKLSNDKLVSSFKGQYRIQSLQKSNDIKRNAFNGEVSAALITDNQNLIMANQYGQIFNFQRDDVFLDQSFSDVGEILYADYLGSDIFLGTSSGEAFILNSADLKVRSKINHGNGWVNKIEISPNKNHYLTAGGRSVKIWNDKLKQVGEIKAIETKGGETFEYNIVNAGFLSDEHFILFYVSNDYKSGGWQLWSVTGEKLQQTKQFGIYPKFSLSKDKKILIAQGLKTAFLFRPDSGDFRNSRFSTVSRFNPESTDIVYGTVEGNLVLANYDLTIVKTLRQVHERRVNCIEFSENLIVSASESGGIAVIEEKGFKVKYKLKGHTSPVCNLSIHPEGQFLASADKAGGVKIWDLKSGQLLFSIDAHDGYISGMFFRGEKLITSSWDKQVKMWSLPMYNIDLESKNEELLGRIKWSNSNLPTDVYLKDAFATINNRSSLHKDLSQNNIALLLDSFKAEGLESRNALSMERLINATKGLKHIIPAHTSSVFKLEFFGKSSLASLSVDGSVKTWDSDNGSLLKDMKHENVLFDFNINKTKPYLASCGFFNDVFIWDYNSGELVKKLTGHKYRISEANFSPDAKYLVSGGREQLVRLWDVSSGKTIKTFDNFKAYVTASEFSEDGKYIIGASSKHIKVIDVEDNNIFELNVGPEEEHKSTISHYDFYGPDSLLASTSDNFFIIWDAKTKKKLFRYECDGEVFRIKFLDAKHVLLDVKTGLQLWEINKGVKLKQFIHKKGEHTKFLLSPNQREIITYSDSSVAIWDLDTAKLSKEIILNDSFLELAISNEGLLASVDKNFNILIWNIKDLPDKNETILSWEAKEIDIFDKQILYLGDSKLAIQDIHTENIREIDFPKNITPLKFVGLNKILVKSERAEVDKKGSDLDYTTFKIYEASSGKLKELKSYEERLNIKSFSLSKDRKKLILNNAESLELIDIQNEAESRIHKFEDGLLESFQDHTANYILTVNTKKLVQLWSPDKEKPYTLSSGVAVSTVAFNEKGSECLVAFENRSIKHFDCFSGKLINQYYGHQELIQWLGFTNKNEIVSLSYDNEFRYWKNPVYKSYESALKNLITKVLLVSENFMVVQFDGEGLQFIDLESGVIIPYFESFSSFSNFSQIENKIIFTKPDGRVKTFSLKANSDDQIKRILKLKELLKK